MADYNVSNDPEAFLKTLSVDPSKITAAGNVAPSVDYSAYAKRNKDAGASFTAPVGAGNVTAGADYEGGVPSATVKTKQKVGYADLSATVKKMMGHQAEMKARADIPMDKGSAYLQASRDESGNTFGAGMQRPFMGGNLSAGVNRSPYDTQANVAYNRTFAQGGLTSLRHNAAAVTAQGRGGDDTLLHVSKKELAGLAKLLGRPLTTNPHTGLQEAFGLKNILPTAAAMLATYLFPPAGPLAAAALAGGASAGTSLIMGAKPRDALTQGLIAGGSAGIMSGLAGPDQAATAANPTAATLPTAAPSVPVPAALPSISAPINPAEFAKANEAELLGSGFDSYPKLTNNLPQPMQTAATTQLPNITPPPAAAAPAAPLTNSEQLAQRYSNIKANLDKPGELMKAVKSPYGAALAYGAYREATRQPEYKEPEERKSNYEALDPYDRKVRFPGSYNPNAEFNYFPGDRYARAAEGGLMSDITNMAQGGIAAFDKGGAATILRNIRRMYKTREEAVRAGVDPRILDYAFGKGEIIGRGDGMSDHVPAQIDGGQEARLSDGEFVIPADVVSGLGNGSTKAGSDHLYKLLDRVRQERTGTKKQGKQIKADNLLPA